MHALMVGPIPTISADAEHLSHIKAVVLCAFVVHFQQKRGFNILCTPQAADQHGFVPQEVHGEFFRASVRGPFCIGTGIGQPCAPCPRSGTVLKE